MLPAASAELAAKWDTHAATIHAALTPLVKEGLLTRQPKIGTFVSKRRTRLSDVGIYYDSNIWLNQANAFKRAVHVELARLLEAGKKVAVCDQMELPEKGIARREVDPVDRNVWGVTFVDDETFYGRPEIGVAAMAFCFPGTNPKGGDFPPPPRCAQLWRPQLLAGSSGGRRRGRPPTGPAAYPPRAPR